MRSVIFIMALAAAFGFYPLTAIAQNAPAAKTFSANEIHKLAEKAGQGDARAQIDLAGVFASGQGLLNKDYAKAMKWYLRAADQGYAEAQYNIGLLNAN